MSAAALLAEVVRIHDPLVAARLAACEARFRPELRSAEVRATLTRAGVAASDAILAFDARYGGLVVPRTADGIGTLAAPVLRFGPSACVAAPRAPDAYFASPSFAPAIFTWDDLVYLLDANGRAFTGSLDTLAHPFAPSGDALVARVLLFDAIRARGLEPGACVLELAGRRAAELAHTLAVPAIALATADDARFYGDADVLVLDEAAGGPSRAEAPFTLVAAAHRDRLPAALRATLA